MNIQPVTTTPQFGSLLTKLFKRGKLKDVEYGLYGGKLTSNNVTDEHVIPRSKGGPDDIGNLALATKSNNSSRGNRPLSDYLTDENLSRYTKQFEGINYPQYNFNGKSYIKRLLNSIAKALGMK